jgi:nucleoside-diphosphate-sugar epimerase/quercetin dioxygenase-like cupin family protein/SAM-dependent methyltransferase
VTQKIVITGALGYIGTELCKMYSGEARFKNIIAVDNRFVSERVKQLRDWGIDFIQASILECDAISKIVSDADVVIHLAGITDVAYTKTDSNSEQDALIKKTSIDGTRNIINSITDDCKLIFPSTHVVYEGVEDTRLDILETEKPCPVLSYSESKVQTELDLVESSKNYIVLRLATVCGYSTDTMRINIMPNLFSKIASQKGTIKLFSGGVQLKSLVPLLDVVRCMKFMAEKTDINREIFHLSKESMTVKEVSEICKKFSPELNLIETDDEIPNLGYTISNEKLLNTGFEFRHTVEECIKEMVQSWSEKKINPDLEYIDKGGKEYVDDRGRILNYELTEPINLIGMIDSKKGTVRANHYHPIQEQKCLLVEGQYISVIKDLSVPNAPIETRVINKGDVAIIKPNVAHTMVFTEDSVFLNLVRGEREHENYGISHTIPYKLVDDEMRDRLLDTYKTSCRSCGNIHLERCVSLGTSPLANNLVESKDEQVVVHPLEMNYCPECQNCQLSVVVPPEEMFDNYLYVSSTSSKFVNHFEEAAKKYIKEFELDENSFVIDIGSNDGVALKPLQEKGIKVLGVEPAKNLAEMANANKIPTYNEYFNKDIVEDLVSKYGKANLVTASNVFAHSDKLKEIATNAFDVLDENGVLIVEVQYLLSTLQDLTFDNIYHEHTNYWSVTSIDKFFDNMDLCVYKVKFIDTHGGSIRVYVRRNNELDVTSSVGEFIEKEKDYGLDNLGVYREFGKSVYEMKSNVRKNIDKLKQDGLRIAGYAAPAKATTALNFFGIDDSDIEYVIEDNSLKHNKFIPCVNIPIKDKKYCLENLPDVVIVLAWNFFDYIKEQNQDLINLGCEFINLDDLMER